MRVSEGQGVGGETATRWPPPIRPGGRRGGGGSSKTAPRSVCRRTQAREPVGCRHCARAGATRAWRLGWHVPCTSSLSRCPPFRDSGVLLYARAFRARAARSARCAAHDRTRTVCGPLRGSLVSASTCDAACAYISIYVCIGWSMLSVRLRLRFGYHFRGRAHPGAGPREQSKLTTLTRLLGDTWRRGTLQPALGNSQYMRSISDGELTIRTPRLIRSEPQQLMKPVPYRGIESPR